MKGLILSAILLLGSANSEGEQENNEDYGGWRIGDVTQYQSGCHSEKGLRVVANILALRERVELPIEDCFTVNRPIGAKLLRFIGVVPITIHGIPFLLWEVEDEQRKIEYILRPPRDIFYRLRMPDNIPKLSRGPFTSGLL